MIAFIALLIWLNYILFKYFKIAFSWSTTRSFVKIFMNHCLKLMTKFQVEIFFNIRSAEPFSIRHNLWILFPFRFNLIFLFFFLWFISPSKELSISDILYINPCFFSPNYHFFQVNLLLLFRSIPLTTLCFNDHFPSRNSIKQETHMISFHYIDHFIAMK